MPDGTITFSVTLSEPRRFKTYADARAWAQLEEVPLGSAYPCSVADEPGVLVKDGFGSVAFFPD